MREIIFRGKGNPKYNDGSWFEGYYSKCAVTRGLQHSIVTGTETGCVINNVVIPETVGQFTGLTDKNGKRIFEGDIVKYLYLDPCNDVFNKTNCGAVIYSENAAFTVEGDNLLGELWDLEVVGSIHDSPEMVEVKR